MNKRRKFLAIVMSMVALGTVTVNQVSRAMDNKSGAQSPAKYWNTSTQKCEDCTLQNPGAGFTCAPGGSEPCVCTRPDAPPIAARMLVGEDNQKEENCVQLFRIPN